MKLSKLIGSLFCLVTLLTFCARPGFSEAVLDISTDGGAETIQYDFATGTTDVVDTSLGDWTLVASIASSSSPSAQPALDLSVLASCNISAAACSGANSLTITVSDVGFTSPAAAGDWFNEITGAIPGGVTVTQTAWVDSSDTQLASCANPAAACGTPLAAIPGVVVGPVTLTGPATGASVTGGPAMTGTPYALTLQQTISGKGSFISTDGPLGVPEPSSMALLGTGLLGFVAFAARKKKFASI